MNARIERQKPIGLRLNTLCTRLLNSASMSIILRRVIVFFCLFNILYFDKDFYKYKN